MYDPVLLRVHHRDCRHYGTFHRARVRAAELDVGIRVRLLTAGRAARRRSRSRKWMPSFLHRCRFNGSQLPVHMSIAAATVKITAPVATVRGRVNGQGGRER